MKQLKDWIKEDLPEIKKISTKEYNDSVFHRDPVRNQIIDGQFMFSPADGTVLYAKTVNPEEEIIEVKGKNFTLGNLLQREVNFPAIVIGIFLSQYDVHITRSPTSGYIEYIKLPKITTVNRPMLQEEENIFDGLIDEDTQEYAFVNERYLQTIKKQDFEYYVVLIADKDIDVVAHHFPSGKQIIQNTRTATIKWGSQVCLVLPITGKENHEILVERGVHIEAGIDPIIKISKNGSQIKEAGLEGTIPTVMTSDGNIENTKAKEGIE